MAASSAKKLILHNFYRSSCSARLRIALHHKQIPFEYLSVNINTGEQNSEAYIKLNPSQAVPTLAIPGENGAPPDYITQSFAALEWLDEAYPNQNPLLPPPDSPQALLLRARIRSIVQIIVGDVQPITNTKVQKHIRGFGYDSAKWTAEWYAVGLRAYESVVSEIAGKYSVGDVVTMADVCLAPAIWNCEAVGLSLDEFPTVKRVYAELMRLEAFQKSHWKAQVDCPENLK